MINRIELKLISILLGKAESLIGAVGGILGVYLGFSFLAIYEFLEVLFRSGVMACKSSNSVEQDKERGEKEYGHKEYGEQKRSEKERDQTERIQKEPYDKHDDDEKREKATSFSEQLEQIYHIATQPPPVPPVLPPQKTRKDGKKMQKSNSQDSDDFKMQINSFYDNLYRMKNDLTKQTKPKSRWVKIIKEREFWL